MGWNSLYITRHFRLVSHIEEMITTEVSNARSFLRETYPWLTAPQSPPGRSHAPPNKAGLLHWGNYNGLGHKTPPLAVRLTAFLSALILQLGGAGLGGRFPCGFRKGSLTRGALLGGRYPGDSIAILSRHCGKKAGRQ